MLELHTIDWIYPESPKSTRADPVSRKTPHSDSEKNRLVCAEQVCFPEMERVTGSENR